MPHPVFKPGSVAVVTGGGSGIGRAAALRFADLGLRVCIADVDAGKLRDAETELTDRAKNGADDIMAAEVDVSQFASLQALDADVRARFGGTDVLMNNAGMQPGSAMFGDHETWERILAVNLGGIINGTHAFVPGMIERGQPGIVINTGSKQGITMPPGDPAYNVSKAGVKAFTEALQHDLRNTEKAHIEAHLLIPGFVFTNLTAGERTEKPDAAWTPEQTVDFMMASLEAGDFYILCPDNAVPRALDERRILWTAGDIVENRPPLSRWHTDYADAFEAFAKKGG